MLRIFLLQCQVDLIIQMGKSLYIILVEISDLSDKHLGLLLKYLVIYLHLKSILSITNAI